MLVTQGNCAEDLNQLRAGRLIIKVLVDEMRGEKIVMFKRSSLAVRNRSNKEVTNGPQKPKTDFLQIKERILLGMKSRHPVKGGKTPPETIQQTQTEIELGIKIIRASSTKPT